MKQIIIIVLTLLIIDKVHAEAYETAQRLDEGDVISAQVLNDILDRIELALKPIERSELIGIWNVTQYVCVAGLNNPYNDAVTGFRGCLTAYGYDGSSSVETGLSGKREDTWTLTAVDGSSTKFNLASTNYNFIINHSSGTVGQSDLALNSGKTHECAVISGQALMACALDKVLNEDGSRYFAAYQHIQRLSSTRLKLWWGADRGQGLFNIMILDKTDIPPKAPTSLAVSLSGSGSTKSASLSWTINGSNVTGGSVKRKTSVSGDWSTLSDTTASTYTDSSIALNNTYWYRVFASNSDGTSVGSNVIKVNWYNTPPSINIPSTISVDENYSTASNFKTLSVSDADGETLTITLDSQSPSNDASDFTLATDGGLFFNASPDYESPADYDTNNIYDLTLTATDGVETVSQDFSVVVLDVNE